MELYRDLRQQWKQPHQWQQQQQQEQNKKMYVQCKACSFVV
jgi:hypothetical protein